MQGASVGGPEVDGSMAGGARLPRSCPPASSTWTRSTCTTRARWRPISARGSSTSRPGRPSEFAAPGRATPPSPRRGPMRPRTRSARGSWPCSQKGCRCSNPKCRSSKTAATAGSSRCNTARRSWAACPGSRRRTSRAGTVPGFDSRLFNQRDMQVGNSRTAHYARL
jgi:hypothetical protein